MDLITDSPERVGEKNIYNANFIVIGKLHQYITKYLTS